MSAPVAAWPHALVVVATSWWDGTPLLERHLTNELSQRIPILYVEPPSSLLSPFRSAEVARAARTPGLRLESDNIAVLSVRVPPPMERRGVKALGNTVMRRRMRDALRRLGSPAIEAVIVTSTDPLLGYLGERRGVYYAKDDYRAAEGLVGISAPRLQASVRRLLDTADTVVAVTPQLARSLGDRRATSVFLPNGCDPVLFETTVAPDPGNTPLVAFVGHLSDRVDPLLLEAVIDAGIRLRMIGPRQETVSAGRFAGLVASQRVEWVGPVPYRDLPSQLGDVTTCLLPYADTEFNRASFPLKLLEYLAAGRRVVATDLPAVRWLDTPLITVATEPGPFSKRVAESLAYPLLPQEMAVRRELARRHSWSDRAQRLWEILGLEQVMAQA